VKVSKHLIANHLLWQIYSYLYPCDGTPLNCGGWNKTGCQGNRWQMKVPLATFLYVHRMEQSTLNVDVLESGVLRLRLNDPNFW
jgi:hypothetical protein